LAPTFDRPRATAARRCPKGKNALWVSSGERKVRTELAVLASECARLDGTAQWDLEFAEPMDAIYESCHGPVAFGKDDR
jgi:hypothetical protein